eukprot:6024848-Pyramimonas_sp.AAC.1
MGSHDILLNNKDKTTQPQLNSSIYIARRSPQRIKSSCLTIICRSCTVGTVAVVVIDYKSYQHRYCNSARNIALVPCVTPPCPPTTAPLASSFYYYNYDYYHYYYYDDYYYYYYYYNYHYYHYFYYSYDYYCYHYYYY